LKIADFKLTGSQLPKVTIGNYIWPQPLSGRYELLGGLFLLYSSIYQVTQGSA
jgi:hypothetical protein